MGHMKAGTSIYTSGDLDERGHGRDV